jgi:hypothetical protein
MTDDPGRVEIVRTLDAKLAALLQHSGVDA